MEGKKAKKAMSRKRFTALWAIGLAVILIVGIAFNVALQIFSSYVDGYLGAGTYTIKNLPETESWATNYYSLDYDSPQDTASAAADMVELLESEGIVLLKNNGTLPLNGTKVTLLGRDAADPVYGGSGSGSVDEMLAFSASSKPSEILEALFDRSPSCFSALPLSISALIRIEPS